MSLVGCGCGTAACSLPSILSSINCSSVRIHQLPLPSPSRKSARSLAACCRNDPASNFLLRPPPLTFRGLGFRAERGHHTCPFSSHVVADCLVANHGPWALVHDDGDGTAHSPRQRQRGNVISRGRYAQTRRHDIPPIVGILHRQRPTGGGKGGCGLRSSRSHRQGRRLADDGIRVLL
jgi:hypothetical protein